MKKYYYSLIAATAMLFATTSCSQDEELVQQSGNDVTTFKVELQGATGSRTAGDGNTVNTLYYEVHQNGKIVKDETANITNGKATVDIPLLRGEVYDIIFWAQSNEATIYNATDLTNIQVSYATDTKANKETYDAFFNALAGFKATKDETPVQLRRPFAQLNIGTIESDWNTAKDMIGGTDDPVTTSEVTVKGLATNFNALTGLAAGEADVTFHQDVLLGETFDLGTIDAEGNPINYQSLAMNYLLVPGEKAPQGEGTDTHTPATTEAIKTNVDITATFWRGETELFSLDISNATIQRNYRTNIYGTLLSENKTFEVEVAPIFDGDYNKELTTANTDEELEQLLRQDVENIVIDLAESGRAATGKEYKINIGSSTEKYYFGSTNTKTITINANGNTINFVHNDGDWNYIRCVNENAKWIINDAYLTNSNKNNSAWNRHNIRFYNAVELNDVTSDKAIALLNDGKLEGVKISDVHTDNSEAYALWISPNINGQTVDINNCEFTAHSSKSGDRGITINNQYQKEINGVVTLNISNSKFVTQKKAAVMYKDEDDDKNGAGAEYKAVINWGEGNDISGVAADPVNAVWIDEDSGKYAANLTVNGASVVVEGSAASTIVTVSTAEELKEAITAANAASAEEATTIYLKEGTYTGAFNINSKNIVLTSNGNAVIDGLVHGLSAKIAINNITLTNATAIAGGVTNRTGADYYCLGGYAADWIIENCTFNVSNQGNAAGKGAINIYANNNDTKQELNGVKYDFILKNCVFNCNGERPIRGKINSYIEGCTFNDQYRYAIQVQGNVLDVETVTFINNKIVNPCQTSIKEFAAGIQISGSQICEGVTFNISGNTMQSSKFMNLLYVYDDDEDINIESCTVNGATFISETEAKAIGTIAEATEITLMTAEDLVSFANAVNGGKQSFAGKTVKLGADIDLKGIDWEPIGQTGATTFNGVFDGQNHTISNLSVDSENETGANYASGLFGWVETHTNGNGQIKNVKISGATIKGHHCCGALVGYITEKFALVENCHVENANVNCTYANSDASGDKAGALIGNATVATVVKDCTATGSTVSAARDAGQLIGAGKEANVTNCSATDVVVKNNNTGTGANIRNEVIGRLL